MEKLLKIVFFIWVVSFSVSAQTKIETGADSWNGLKINVTTPQDALTAMGKPTKDAVEELDYGLLPNKSFVSFFLGINIGLPNSWLTPKRNEKVFRKLVFERNGTYKKVELSFLEDKLYLIDLTLSTKKSERLSAADLEELYKTNFVSTDSIPKDANLSEFEGQKEPTFPKVYPIFYQMLSVAPTSILRGFVNNTEKKKKQSNDADKVKRQLFPGFVARFQIFYRLPEKDKNSAQQ